MAVPSFLLECYARWSSKVRTSSCEGISLEQAPFEARLLAKCFSQCQTPQHHSWSHVKML
eukprot:6474083-Amphidinium_carterae.3